MLKRLLGLGAVLFFLGIAPAFSQPVTFTLQASGTHHVTVGHYMLFMVLGTVTSGVDPQGVTVPSVSGMPAGVRADWVNMQRFCCGTTIWQISGYQTVKITADATTKPGTYSLAIKYTTTGASVSLPFTLYVDAQPAPIVPAAFPPNVPLASQSQWEANMLNFGKIHCAIPDAAFVANGNTWYYDGAWVYYQIANYTGDKTTWQPCAAMLVSMANLNPPQAAFRDYVLANSVASSPDVANPWSAKVPGYYTYSRGIAEHYLRTKDPLSLQAVQALANGGYSGLAYPNAGVNPAYLVDWSVSRETALAIRGQYALQIAGGQLGPNFQDLVEMSIGHMNQWFVDKSAVYVQPFMAALTSEALIDYWTATKDSRIPALLQLAADQMMALWDATSQSWVYNNGDTTTAGSTGPAPDLNLLIAPLYGWVFSQTGLQKYRDQGDAAFVSGVSGAYLGSPGAGGKQFSQNYHWSSSYLQWRKSPVSSVPAPVSTCGPMLTSTASGVSWAAGQCAFK